MNRVVFVTRSRVQFHEITSSQHGDAQIRNRDGIIYTEAGRIDISARECACYVYMCCIRALHACTAPGLSPQNDISPEADRMKTGIPLAMLLVKCVCVSKFHRAICNSNSRFC